MALAAVLILAGCSSDDEAPAGQRSFGEAVDGGAPCDELFDIRNERDPKDPNIGSLNETLRSIGCSNSSSERTDQ